MSGWNADSTASRIVGDTACCMRISAIRIERLSVPLDPPFPAAWDPIPRTAFPVTIVRINAGCRQHGVSYSRFVAGLKAAGIDVDRKILADLAVHDPAAFGALVAVAREALQAA